jgi:hypothetical protein
VNFVHDEVEGEEYHEGRIRGLAMEVRVSALLRDLLSVPGSRSSSMEVGMATHVKFRVLPFRVKIQGLALIGCAWQ